MNLVPDGAPSNWVFIHIPKTAGTYVRTLFENQHGDIGHLYPEPPWRALKELDRAECSDLVRRRYVFGHEFLCDLETVFPRTTRYASIMRNPVDRVISFYNHAHSHFEKTSKSRFSLLKFLDSRFSVQCSNYQVRHLSSLKGRGPSNEEDLASAIENVRSGRVEVGIQERLRPSFSHVAMLRDSGIKRTPKKINTSLFGFARDSFTRFEIDEIRRRNTLDFKLYELCLNLLEKPAMSHTEMPD